MKRGRREILSAVPPQKWTCAVPSKVRIGRSRWLWSSPCFNHPPPTAVQPLPPRPPRSPAPARRPHPPPPPPPHPPPPDPPNPPARLALAPVHGPNRAPPTRSTAPSPASDPPP